MKKDSQKRSHSEAMMNIGIAFIVATLLNLFFLPYFAEGIEQKDLLIAVFISIVFTIASYCRAYSLRRVFDRFSRKRRKDTKSKSHSEIMMNIAVGYFIAMALNLTFLPLFAEEIANQNITIALIISVVYNVVSYWRSFFLRRLFNKFKHNASFGKFFHQVKNGEIKLL